MNITFLIGNGFDRNLGLKTTYADFISHYKQTTGKSELLEKFRKHIKDNEELWCNAEVALGQYTNDFEAGNGMAFSECHQDMCEYLVAYLAKEEGRLKYEEFSEKILSAFKNIVALESPFPTVEREKIKAVFDHYKSEQYNFNFICFNYTPTLDNCLKTVKSNTSILGSHRYGNNVLSHNVGQLCHVHGTLEKEIVFAVNDESQIAKPDIFNFEDGEIYKHFLIKQQANVSYQENTDNKSNQILQNSTIIYIYGMSLGETDKLWWNRICQWLKGSEFRHLIIQNYDMREKGVYQLRYQLSENHKKKELLKYSDYDEKIKQILMTRIHITGYNIFSDINNAVNIDTAMSAKTEDSVDGEAQSSKKVV